ncbi:MAG: hypothetical protein RRB22_09420 [Gammaproteobacteria bacterium]|nr:hypothetical protein [Gammaproteobacteria bacterium]
MLINATTADRSVSLITGVIFTTQKINDVAEVSKAGLGCQSCEGVHEEKKLAITY